MWGVCINHSIPARSSAAGSGNSSAARWRTQQQLDELLVGQKSRYDRMLQQKVPRQASGWR
jgi:hypothetical protein